MSSMRGYLTYEVCDDMRTWSMMNCDITHFCKPATIISNVIVRANIVGIQSRSSAKHGDHLLTCLHV